MSGVAALSSLPRAVAISNTYLIGSMTTTAINDTYTAAGTNIGLSLFTYGHGLLPGGRVVAAAFSPHVSTLNWMVSKTWVE